MKSEWTHVAHGLPTGNCLACYKNSNGKDRIVKAFYAKQFEIEASGDDVEDRSEYNEETDEYYLPEGWYEVI